MKTLALLIAAAMLLGAPDARAQGYVHTFACGTVPPGAAFDVQVLDDTDPVVRLRDVVVKRLVQVGFKVSKNAPLRLLIDPETDPGKSPQIKRDLSKLDDSQGTTLGGQSELSRKLEELREKQSTERALTPGNGNVRVAMIINRKSDGRCLWQGEVRYEDPTSDYWEVAVMIAPRLVDAIGKPVDNKPFQLR